MPTQTAPAPSLQSNQYRAELEKTRKDIKAAFQAGLFFGGVNLLMFFATLRSSAFAEGKIPGFLIGYMMFEIALIFWLSFGISQSKKGSAQMMLGYFLFSKMVQIASTGFTPFMLPVGGLLTYYFYRGVVATAAYPALQSLALDVNGGDQIYRSPEYHAYEDDAVDNSVNTAPAVKTVTKFWVADELIKLCKGDRSQAEWLIHQLRVKHPSQDIDWYNERAIRQLSAPKESESKN